jgi:hypothetical protein
MRRVATTLALLLALVATCSRAEAQLAFTDLPEYWACPNCEAPRHKFLKLAP